MVVRSSGEQLKPAPPRWPGPELLWHALSYGVLLILALAMILPFCYALSLSLRSFAEASQGGWQWIPNEFTFSAYQRLLAAGFRNAALNSLAVSVFVVVGRVVLDSMAGYALSRLRFPGRRVILGLIVVSMFIPGVVLIVPRFLILSVLGMLNTYMGLMIPLITDAFGIFLMKQVFDAIPPELEEAAQIDGASRVQIFVQITLPLSAPGLASMTIFAFQGAWNELVHYLVVAGNSPSLYTLTLWLAQLRGAGFQADWPVVMAGVILTIIPTLLVFLFFQRFFTENIAHSGVTGV